MRERNVPPVNPPEDLPVVPLLKSQRSQKARTSLLLKIREKEELCH
jgi:hypothetical protein